MRVNSKLFNIVKRFCKKAGILTTSIILKNNDGEIIGAAQSINYEQKRNGNYIISANRIRLNKPSISDLFQSSYIRSQTKPIHIEIDDGYDIINIENAWILNMSYSYYTQFYVIIDNVEFEAGRLWQAP